MSENEERRGAAIASSETRGAEQNCTALLKDDMMPFCAVHLAQEDWCRKIRRVLDYEELSDKFLDLPVNHEPTAHAHSQSRVS